MNNEELWDVSDGQMVESATKSRKLQGLARLKAAHEFAKLNGTLKKVSCGDYTGP